MYFEFETPTFCVLATYVVHDDGESPTTYEFKSWRTRKLSDENWRHKLENELDHARQHYPSDHIIVVAYERCDESTAFEGNSYAVLAIESEHPCRPTLTHIYDEIPEQIENW